MRPQPKDQYGRPLRGNGQRQSGYGQQGGHGQQRPGYGQRTEESRQEKPPARPQPPANIKADVIWALRNAGGGMSLFDIGTKIISAGKPRYGETKIQHILEMLVQDGKVSKAEQTGRVTYKWMVEAF
jgi:hypothetical protein